MKIVSTNICGSDQHMVRGRSTAPSGMVLGHGRPCIRSLQRRLWPIETADQCLFFIQERIDWLRADAYFVQKHMTTPTGFDVTSDWVARWQFGELFDEPRELLRRAICKTQPANVVNLLRLQGERIELPI